MSKRIANRPRHHMTRYFPQPSSRRHKDYLHTRWTYRRFTIPYQRRTLGQSLSLLPLGYKLIHRIALRA